MEKKNHASRFWFLSNQIWNESKLSATYLSKLLNSQRFKILSKSTQISIELITVDI